MYRERECDRKKNLNPKRMGQIFTEQAAESGKPANIVEKMAQGRMTKWQVGLFPGPKLTDLCCNSRMSTLE